MSAFGRSKWQVEWPYLLQKSSLHLKKVEQETNQIVYYNVLRKTCNYISHTIHGIFTYMISKLVGKYTPVPWMVWVYGMYLFGYSSNDESTL